MRTTEKIVEQRKVVKNGRGKYQRKRKSCFPTIDHFMEKLNPTNSLWFLPK